MNLAAIAEASSGAAKDVEDFVLVWIARGVGLAVVLGGKLHRGVTGAAGEIGYLPVPGAPIARDVSRRSKGSFQQVAGADAVKAIAREHGFRGSSAGDAVKAAVAAGEKGHALLDELARRVSLGVASVGVVLDPALVVLAGDDGRAGGSAHTQQKQQEVGAITVVSPKVVATEVESEPVLHGAILTGLDAVREEVFGSTA